MGTARVYRLRRKNRVNCFTYTEYNDICKDIKGANPVNNLSRSVLVTVTSGKTNLADFISRVVARNGKYKEGIGNKMQEKAIIPVSYNNHLGKKDVIRFVYPTREAAVTAAGIINRMAFPDSIVPENVNNDGSVTTRQNLNVVVDVKKDENGAYLADSGSNYEPGKVSGVTSDPETEKSGPNWYLIGGAVVVGIILILAIVKLAKK